MMQRRDSGFSSGRSRQGSFGHDVMLLRHHRQPREAIDYYLDRRGWYRKRVPRDPSCLFRVVAEQMFGNQVFHPIVRRSCVRYMARHMEEFLPMLEGRNPEDYSKNMADPETFGSDVEIWALANLYKRDFIVYENAEKEPENRTGFGFPKQFRLSFGGTRSSDNGSHYDSVWRKESLTKAGIAQALVYEALYKKTFGMGEAVDQFVHIMLSPPASFGHQRRYFQKESFYVDPDVRLDLTRFGPPFPYKIAKSLQPHIYRNVDFDVWIEQRKELERTEKQMTAAAGSLAPGSPCTFRLQEDGKELICKGLVQTREDPKGFCRVFIYELGEQRDVSMASLTPRDVAPHLPLGSMEWRSSGPRLHTQRGPPRPMRYESAPLAKFQNRHVADHRGFRGPGQGIQPGYGRFRMFDGRPNHIPLGPQHRFPRVRAPGMYPFNQAAQDMGGAGHSFIPGHPFDPQGQINTRPKGMTQFMHHPGFPVHQHFLPGPHYTQVPAAEPHTFHPRAPVPLSDPQMNHTLPPGLQASPNCQPVLHFTQPQWPPNAIAPNVAGDRTVPVLANGELQTAHAPATCVAPAPGVSVNAPSHMAYSPQAQPYMVAPLAAGQELAPCTSQTVDPGYISLMDQGGLCAFLAPPLVPEPPPFAWITNFDGMIHQVALSYNHDGTPVFFATGLMACPPPAPMWYSDPTMQYQPDPVTPPESSENSESTLLGNMEADAAAAFDQHQSEAMNVTP